MVLISLNLFGYLDYRIKHIGGPKATYIYITVNDGVSTHHCAQVSYMYAFLNAVVW